MSKGKRCSAFLAFMAATGCNLGNASERQGLCPELTKSQAISAAVSEVVRLALKSQEQIAQGSCPTLGWRKGDPCINSAPYFTAQTFLAKNPNCCRVLDKIPGDYPVPLRPYIREEKHPKVYLVDMSYQAFSLDKFGQSYTYRHETISAVTCFGEVLHGGFSLGR